MAEFETLAIKIPKSMAVEFERARKLLGMPSRASYVWHLHLARRLTEMLLHTEKQILFELGSYGNFRFNQPTPNTKQLANYVLKQDTKEQIDLMEKSLESLAMKGLVAMMPTPIQGNFANDVMTRAGMRYRLTPAGVEAVLALGQTPKLPQ